MRLIAAADLAPDTVTAAGTGELAAVPRERRRGRRPGLDASTDAALSTVSPTLLRAALRLAGGDPSRLHFVSATEVSVLDRPRADWDRRYAR